MFMKLLDDYCIDAEIFCSAFLKDFLIALHSWQLHLHKLKSTQLAYQLRQETIQENFFLRVYNIDFMKNVAFFNFGVIHNYHINVINILKKNYVIN
jgi:hypothetical protein